MMLNLEFPIDDIKLARVTNLILEHRRPAGKDWWWPLNELNGKPTDKKTANKFLLCNILDWQMNSAKVLENSKRFSLDVLHDPEDLWDTILKYSEEEWMTKYSEFRLHWLHAAHNRVWRIGRNIVKYYDGDARKIWEGKSPGVTIDILNKLGVGENISRMCVGALIDTNQIKGNGDVKADVHLKRVLGRVVKGEPISESEVIEITRKMYPENPWLLDREFWMIGKELCHPNNPKCFECYLKPECLHSKN